MEGLKDPTVKFLNPFLPFDKKNLVTKILELDEFKQYNFTKEELNEAAEKAEQEYQTMKGYEDNKNGE